MKKSHLIIAVVLIAIFLFIAWQTTPQLSPTKISYQNKKTITSFSEEDVLDYLKENPEAIEQNIDSSLTAQSVGTKIPPIITSIGVGAGATYFAFCSNLNGICENYCDGYLDSVCPWYYPFCKTIEMSGCIDTCVGQLEAYCP